MYVYPFEGYTVCAINEMYEQASSNRRPFGKKPATKTESQLKIIAQ